jgi:hypothetical protein
MLTSSIVLKIDATSAQGDFSVPSRTLARSFSTPVASFTEGYKDHSFAWKIKNQ